MAVAARTAPTLEPVSTSAAGARPTARSAALVGVAIVLTGLNLRTAVTSVGPVLQEVTEGLRLGSAAAGAVTALPVVCFAVVGFAGPPLAARYRDGHVLATAMLLVAAGLVVRALAGSFALFATGTVVAMAGGALGNVLLPGLVKRWFPERTGLLVGAYSAAMAVGAAVAAAATAPIAAAGGAQGWRWALGCWAVLAAAAALPWLLAPRLPGSSRAAHTAVRVGDLRRSRLAGAMAAFFGLQALQAYVVLGWSAQYLRDQGMPASTAGLLLGLNTAATIPLSVVVPLLAVRQRLQRPLLLACAACLLTGWTGLLLAPLAVTGVWMVLLALGNGTFPMALTLLGLRARTPEATAALSTTTQGFGYALAGAGPLLVGVTLEVTGGYAGMFVLVCAGTAAMVATGWAVCRERYVDDELVGPAGGGGPPGRPPVSGPPGTLVP